jgi:hypothetical protein
MTCIEEHVRNLSKGTMTIQEQFINLAKNKEITDEDLVDELCLVLSKNKYVSYQSTIEGRHAPMPTFYIEHAVETVKRLRKLNPGLDLALASNGFNPKHDTSTIERQIEGVLPSTNTYYQAVEKYEMKQRIRSLEQTLAAFMEQTKAEHLAQEATIQSLSKEMDEFQEEFYDCQSELKEHVGLMEDALKEAVENVLELHQLKEEREHLVLKYKTA